MPNLSELNPAARRRVLVYGDVGTGKTIFASSWPGLKHFCDFDGKVSSASAYHWGNAEKLAQIDYDEYKTNKPYDRFNMWLIAQSALAERKEFKIDTLIIDSLTEMISAGLIDFMNKNGAIQRTRTTLGPIPSMLDYRALEIQMRDVFGRLFALPCHIVVTAHLRTKPDETTGKIHTGPEGPASVIKHLQIIFEEVYRSYVEGEGEKRRYMAQTQANAQYPARSQIRGMPAAIELSYEAIKRYGG